MSFNDVTITVAIGVHEDEHFVVVSKNKEIDFVVSRAGAIELIDRLQQAVEALKKYEPS